MYLNSLLFLLTVTPHGAIDSIFADVGLFFKTRLNKTDFFTDGAKSVQFLVSINGMPDMPEWMRLEQKAPDLNATIYGTPSVDDAGTIKLAVVAWNKATYATERIEYLFTVQNKKVFSHHLEFKVLNKDLVDLFNSSNDFKTVVEKHWSNAEVVSGLEKPSDRHSGANPLPGNKEGVFVKIGGSAPPPARLRSIIIKCASVPDFIHEDFLRKGYDIDWCSLSSELQPTKEIVETQFSVGDQFEPVGHFEPVKLDDSIEDLTVDFIYVVIAILLGVVFVVFLTVVMCCSRERVKQRSLKHDYQKSLRKAATQLRDMPNKKKTGFFYGELNEEEIDSKVLPAYKAPPEMPPPTKKNLP